MGLLYEKQQVEEDVCTGFRCNKCEQNFDVADIDEMQEMLHVSDTGGYGSIIGDGTPWSVTLCQRCMLDVLGGYIQYGPYDNAEDLIKHLKRD